MPKFRSVATKSQVLAVKTGFKRSSTLLKQKRSMPTWVRSKKPIEWHEAPVPGQRAWADFMMSTLTRLGFFYVSLVVQAGLHRFWAYARLPLPLLLSMGVLMAQVTLADPGTSDDGVEANTTPKTLFVVVDGIPADVIERVSTPGIDAVAAKGSYQRAYVGGELDI